MNVLPCQITNIGFDGYAVGGLSVGEGHKIMCILDSTTNIFLRTASIFNGVGRPLDLVEGVARDHYV